MLNGAILVGVPMVALLAAAFYIFSKTRRDNCHGDGGGAPQSFPADMNSRSVSTQARRRRNHNGNTSGNNTDTSPQTPGITHEEQCEICFEDVRKVQLYPCRHSDICQICATRILLSSRECPFCRARITGYTDVDTGHLYG